MELKLQPASSDTIYLHVLSLYNITIETDHNKDMEVNFPSKEPSNDAEKVKRSPVQEQRSFSKTECDPMAINSNEKHLTMVMFPIKYEKKTTSCAHYKCL